MVDVLLIQPFSRTGIFSLTQMPLNLIYLASSLESNGIEVDVVDLNTTSLNKEELKKRIEKLNPSVIGISVASTTLPECLEIAKSIKNYSDATICIGGPHANGDRNFILRFSKFFDIQFIGEADITFPLIVRSILMGKKIKKKIIHCKFPRNLNLLPSPSYSYHLFDVKKYVPTMCMLTSRGCPYHCSFCCTNKNLRYLSVKKAIEEIKIIKEELKINKIGFQDNNFTINKKWTEEFCKSLKKENLDITWTCQTRADLINSSLLELMKRSGCTFISYGIESFSEKIQKFLNKNISIRSIETSLLLTKKVGIKCGVNLIFGVPEETKEDIEITLFFLRKLQPDYISLSFLIPYPGTAIFEYCKIRGIIKENSWDLYAKQLAPIPICKSLYLSWFDYFNYISKLLKFKSLYGPSFMNFSNLLKITPFSSLRKVGKSLLGIIQTLTKKFVMKTDLETYKEKWL
jgi:radical SAM superfamily enzyme YgiQ (UPF0313 family)